MFRAPQKYSAKKTDIDGIRFDSIAESKRYLELKVLAMAGAITKLQLQETFHLVVNGVKICKYLADFSYEEDGRRVVEDVKGVRTPEYKLKKKLVLALHGVTVIEIEASDYYRGERRRRR